MEDGINTKCIIHHRCLSVDIYHEVRAHGHPLKPSEMTHSPEHRPRSTRHIKWIYSWIMKSICKLHMGLRQRFPLIARRLCRHRANILINGRTRSSTELLIPTISPREKTFRSCMRHRAVLSNFANCDHLGRDWFTLRNYVLAMFGKLQ